MSTAALRIAIVLLAAVCQHNLDARTSVAVVPADLAGLSRQTSLPDLRNSDFGFLLLRAERVSGSFAVGGGRSFAAGRDYVQFAFSAYAARDGTASGHITLNWPPASTDPASDHGQLLAKVVCGAVVGNAATAYGVVTKSQNPDAEPDADWVGISVADQPDAFLAFFGFGDPPCEFFDAGLYPLSRGHIVVRD